MSKMVHSLRQLPSLKRVLIRLNGEIDHLYKNYYRWYQIEKLSKFEKYVLILEDRRYFSHHGVDVLSVMRALYHWTTFRRRGGASTIEMQFIRTVNNRKEITFRRKIREIILAWLAGYHFHKIALFRSYLNIAFFGSGLIGCEFTSQAVFGCNTKLLDDKDAAVLAAMLVYPKPMNPNDDWAYKIKRRAGYALRLMPRYEKRFDEIGNAQVINV